jgi:CDP-glucose 4,6-dehydratase
VGFSLNYPTKPSLFQKLNLENKINHHIGDINDIDSIKKILKKYKPEIVFHLAAQSLVKQSYENPLSTLQTNIMGTANMLEAIREVDSVKNCIVMTSDKCYKNIETYDAYTEEDPLGGNDPYSASKGAVEIIINSYKKSFFQDNQSQQTKISTIRAGNVIGGGDWSPNRIIPDCIVNFLQNKSVQIRHPNAIRPFQYVLEPISGMLCLAEKMWGNESFDESWNMGPLVSDTPQKIHTIVEKIIKKWGTGTWQDISDQKSFKESNLLLVNSQKAQNRLGWYPIFDIDNAISETIDWYKQYRDNPDEIESYSKKCIDVYVKKAIEKKIKWTSESN